ncbi:MAG TPA: UDP-N-acetylmuramate--L-alanine ligase [Bacillota bacterium]|nr:UDP-N-acetylmuramate--L-alanine ligase [Bacillota bacterium]
MLKKHVHFIGIGGMGMSAIARIMLERGYTVSGSDLRSTELTENLARMGATIYRGHAREHLNGAEMVVYSSAVPEDNPELAAAREAKVELLHRADALAQIINDAKGLAVAGAHGKTTTTSMLGLTLAGCGLDPTVLVGAFSDDLAGNARLGSGEYVVAEADESDYSFLKYTPFVAIITNVEPDHLENFNGDFNKLVEAYRLFLDKVKPHGFSVLCTDDPILREMRGQAKHKSYSYGFNADADYRALNLEFHPQGSSFDICFRGDKLAEVELSVPGEHNVLNALAVLAVGHQLGVDIRCLTGAIRNFHGARRRFQRIGEHNGILVVDDYAHHPTEIKVTLQTARLQGKDRVVAFFQPKRYTRTKFLFDEFTQAFDQADVLILSEIFPFGEAPIPGVTSEALRDAIEARTGREVILLPYRHGEIVDKLMEILRPGDLALIMGAGDDIADLAKKVFAAVKAQQ